MKTKGTVTDIKYRNTPNGKFVCTIRLKKASTGKIILVKAWQDTAQWCMDNTVRAGDVLQIEGYMKTIVMLVARKISFSEGAQ